MTKRSSQANTVVVPAVHADGVDGKVVAAKPVVAPAEAEVAAVKVDAKADEAPVTVIAEPVAALAAPAPMAMVAEPMAVAEPAAAASASAAQGDDDGGTDLTPYIVGGVLILGGVLAVALSSGDTDPIPVTPAPTNTAPNFTSGTTATIAENAPIATVVYDANAADTQGNTITFTLGGTDAAAFAIDPATGVVTLRASADFEAKSTYSITVTATDNGTPSLAATQTIAITVTNVNEAPRITSAATVSTPENVPVATVVYTATAADPDAGTTLTYSIGGTDAAAFAINATTGAVTFRASPDFETKSSYSFTVTATDAATGGLSATQTVTLTVTDVAENPIFTSPASVSIAENAPATNIVFDANATGATSFALSGADAAAFNFDTVTGQGGLKVSADFETKSVYNVTVTATGPGGTSTQNITVNVTDVADAPVFTSPASVTVVENAPATAIVFDANAPGATSFALSGPDAALFNFDTATGQAGLKSSANFEGKSTYNVTVTATGPGGTATQNVVVNVTNVNEAPSFAQAAQSVTFAENGTVAVLTAAATDVDAGGTITYALTGADAGLFNVSSAGVVTFKAAPNFEAPGSAVGTNVYSFNVVATDQGGLSVTQAETVTVTNVNEAPAFAQATQSVNFAENGTGTVLTATAVDPDAGAVLTYSLTGADALLFAINATTGAVTFVASPNFEATPTKTSYSFNVVATDQAGLSSTQAETVTLTNVNERPTITSAATATAIAENGAAGATVYTATATDPDANTTLSYSLGGVDAAAFAINAATGVVTILAPADFETKSSYTFTVTAMDNGNPALASTAQTVALAITDVAEGVRIDGGTIPSGTNADYSGAVGNVTFLESGAAGNISTIAAFTSGDIIQTDVATSSYSFSSVGTDLVISALINGVNSQITLTGAAGNNFIFNEASAEQAVGFDFFRSTIAPPPPASGNIDGAGAVAAYNAGTAANTYTDSAAAPNVTTITNFTGDDRIVATGTTAAAPYSFSSIGNDLVISFLANGVSSQITLVGAANPNVFVFDEASAEQAVGFDFFRYG